MDNEELYKRIYVEISNSLRNIVSVNNDQEMNKPYVDVYTTNQQRMRDEKITELLNQYVDSYKYKNKSNRWYKGILFALCIVILITFSISFIIWMFKIGNSSKSVEDVIRLVSVCITFLTLVVGMLKIITQYVFPEKEEEYITRIVEIIQNNDLENKKENIRVKSTNKQQIASDDKKQ